MPTTIETSKTTAELINAIKTGKVRKSPDRTTLVDEYGEVVARRLAAKGETDYYADVKQKFPQDAVQVCISFEHPLVSVCICVGWGDIV